MHSKPASFFPNLFIAGVSRAGTTALHNTLTQSPEIAGGLHKEQWVYNVKNRFPDRKQIFENEFSNHSSLPYRLDSTPHYFDDHLIWNQRPGTAERDEGASIFVRILSDSPQAKFIISLRNPVHRFLSEYLMNRYKGKPGVAPSLCEHVDAALSGRTSANADYLRMSRYGSMAEHALESVQPQNLSFIIFESWIADFSSQSDSISKFLGLQQSIPRQVRKENSGTRYLRGGNIGLGPRFGRRKRLVSALAKLWEYYLPEIHLFSEITATDISEWLRWDSETEAERFLVRSRKTS